MYSDCQTFDETHSAVAVAEPGQSINDAQAQVAGLTYSDAVASKGLKPKIPMRPPSPASEPVMPKIELPGSPITDAVAMRVVMPRTILRPCEPDQIHRGTHWIPAGLTLS